MAAVQEESNSAIARPSKRLELVHLHVHDPIGEEDNGAQARAAAVQCAFRAGEQEARIGALRI